jgi:hypothetical protein
MKSALLAVLLLLPAPGVLSAQPFSISDAPKTIQELATSFEGRSSNDVRAAIIKRLGVAQRHVGSGYSIEEWDVAEGVITFHPAAGPTFFDPRTNTHLWLLRTTNLAASNILQSYQMLTLADPANHGSQFWLGDLEFGSNSTYRFIDSGQNLNDRAAQTQNFFLLHPAGTVEVQYVGSISPDTLLESTEEGTTVAHLVFTSADHKHAATYSITSSERDRRLVFKADKPLSFYMDTSWKNFWR